MTLVPYGERITLVKMPAGPLKGTQRGPYAAKTTKLNETPRLGLLRFFQLFKSAALLLDFQVRLHSADSEGFFLWQCSSINCTRNAGFYIPVLSVL